MPGEKERVVVCLSDDKQSSENQETTEPQQRDGENESETEKEKSGEKTEEESFITASVGERCEVGFMGGQKVTY